MRRKLMGASPEPLHLMVEKEMRATTASPSDDSTPSNEQILVPAVTFSSLFIFVLFLLFVFSSFLFSGKCACCSFSL
ncbi:hypothetical protein E2C01_095527 [Portunus trituberculatus]|uniref:Transmembrane protein n=1 Tax=Portunus trituberculatus TaxID=210409 RepID=A0A5B7K4A2_PORTR|nr:hypothetical protein [Portunus trituberculatus]